MAFPLAFVPKQSWHVSPRNFGSPRSGGKRKHAASDLYAPVGSPIFAVADGVVKRFAYFYKGTFALVVDHGDFVVRYGEIKKDIAGDLKVGSKVKRGQKIALVGRLTGLKNSMLHFEMYSGKGKGRLTDPTRPPFMRRSDLLDPTETLDQWASGPLPKES